MTAGGRVVGIGGVFFKASNAQALAQWYVNVLGLPQSEDGGVAFLSRDETPGAQTVFATFENENPYFGSALIERLTALGVEILPMHEEYDYGRFAWIVDPEGNRVELWEPKE